MLRFLRCAAICLIVVMSMLLRGVDALQSYRGDLRCSPFSQISNLVECNGHGECDRTVGLCKCVDGYTGFNCSEVEAVDIISRVCWRRSDGGIVERQYADILDCKKEPDLSKCTPYQCLSDASLPETVRLPIPIFAVLCDAFN